MIFCKFIPTLWQISCTLKYSSDRVKKIDSIEVKPQKDLSEKEKLVLASLGVRSIIGIIYVILLFRFLFIPQFFIYSVITLLMAVISSMVLKRLKNIQPKIWFVRIDSIITMLVWLVPFLEVLGKVF